jgi:hypothetical protein
MAFGSPGTSWSINLSAPKEGIPHALNSCNEDVEHEQSIPQGVYGANHVCNGYLHGRQSSIEGESSTSAKEYDSCEEEEFLGWPPELLFTPQYKQGLHQKKRKQIQGENSACRQKAQHSAEGRRQGCQCEGGRADAVCEGAAPVWGNGPGGQEAGPGAQWTGTGEPVDGVGAQRPPVYAPWVELEESNEAHGVGS